MNQATSQTYRLDTILDIMKVPLTGDPLGAVVPVDHTAQAEGLACDILVVGGGLGGVSAALAAARKGHSVCLLEETDWIGGQITSQGVSALDEHEYIEYFGGTRTYYELRENIRDHYRSLSVDPDLKEPLNPGTCWVSRLSFEPPVALLTLNSMLQPAIKAGNLKIFLRTKAVESVVEQYRVTSLKAINLDSRSLTLFRFEYLLDATELGDLLPLTGTEYIVGAESIERTGEPHAQPKEGKTHCVQSCTYTFAMEHRPSEDHTIGKPEGFNYYRNRQPYSLRIHVHGGEIYGEESGWLDYHLFDKTPGTKGPLWLYRRLVESNQFPAHYDNDVTLFNWPGTDYRDLPLVDQTPEDLAGALQEAKRVSIGFLYWLQTECLDSNGKVGNPDIRLRPDVMGSEDGLSKHPYIRECRRIRSLVTITEQDVAIDLQVNPRSAYFDDSVGIGWYPIDIHQAGEGDIGASTRTKPFQIPLGSLIPVRTQNLIAANKNIGTTHITNGCYRLHPVGWNIGESAGLLASYALNSQKLPRAIHSNPELLRDYQKTLVKNGVPLHWLLDVPVSDPDFTAVQMLVTLGGYGSKEDCLEFQPEAHLDVVDHDAWGELINTNISTSPIDFVSMSRVNIARLITETD